MNSGIKDLVKRVFSRSGYYKLHSYLRTRTDKKLLILMYHDLVDDWQGDTDAMPLRENICRTEFAAHLEVLHTDFRVISVEQAVDEIKNNGGLKENSVAITFDDGYASVYHIAFPLLKKYDFPATVYVTTDWINGKMTLWWERLTGMVQQCDMGEVSSTDLGEALGRKLSEAVQELNNSRESKRRLLETAETILREKSDGERQEIMGKLESVLLRDGVYNYAEPSALSWDELGVMAEAGMIPAAHTCSHVNLSHADIGSAEREIEGSRREIEERLGTKVAGFAYPYGQDVSAYARIAPVLKRLGFDYACTAFPGNNNNDSNLYLLRRFTLPPVESKALLRRNLYLGFASGSRHS